MPNYSGVWTLSQQFQGRGQGLWPAVPGAPTIGTATAGASLCASVTFTAPACVGVPAPITGFTVTSTPSGITTSGAASPLVVTGLTAATSYTFRVKATNAAGTGACSAASNSVTAKLASCAVFSTAGTFSWVVPTGVTSIAAIAVGGGGGARGGLNFGGGGGGGLAYLNAQSVTPGETLTVIVGAGGTGGIGSSTSGEASRLRRGGTDLAAAGGGLNGSSRSAGSFITGTSGGTGGVGAWGGGGGPSYSGSGGNGGCYFGAGCQPGGSGGGGGGGLACTTNPTNGTPTLWSGAGGGGGTGIYGAGTGGAGGSAPSVCAPSTIVIGGGGGGGGSPSTGTGTNGVAGGLVSQFLIFNSAGGAGGFPGGGGGSGGRAVCTGVVVSEREGGAGGRGAVRIVWNGCGRGVPSFPSTNVGPS